MHGNLKKKSKINPHKSHSQISQSKWWNYGVSYSWISLIWLVIITMRWESYVLQTWTRIPIWIINHFIKHYRHIIYKTKKELYAMSPITHICFWIKLNPNVSKCNNAVHAIQSLESGIQNEARLRNRLECCCKLKVLFFTSTQYVLSSIKRSLKWICSLRKANNFSMIDCAFCH